MSPFATIGYALMAMMLSSAPTQLMFGIPCITLYIPACPAVALSMAYCTSDISGAFC